MELYADIGKGGEGGGRRGVEVVFLTTQNSNHFSEALFPEEHNRLLTFVLSSKSKRSNIMHTQR